MADCRQNIQNTTPVQGLCNLAMQMLLCHFVQHAQATGLQHTAYTLRVT